MKSESMDGWLSEIGTYSAEAVTGAIRLLTDDEAATLAGRCRQLARVELRGASRRVARLQSIAAEAEGFVRKLRAGK